MDFEPFGGVMPDNWKEITLTKICSQIRPGTNFQPQRVLNGIPFLNVKNINSGYIDTTDSKHITEEDYKRIHKTWIPEAGDILISRIGTLGLVAVIKDEDLPLAVHYNFIDIKSDFLPSSFLYFLFKSEYFQEKYHFIKKQSVQEYVTIDDVASIRIVFPMQLDQISNLIKLHVSLFAQIENNQKENKILTQLRDTLLPKLMSGEIDVSNIEIEEFLDNNSTDKLSFIQYQSKCFTAIWFNLFSISGHSVFKLSIFIAI